MGAFSEMKYFLEKFNMHDQNEDGLIEVELLPELLNIVNMSHEDCKVII